MRINKYVAQASGLSRRAADSAIEQGRVLVEGKPPQAGQIIAEGQVITLDGKQLRAPRSNTTIMLNKPRGYVVSRNGQGSKTVYDLLPANLHSLKPIGRLDKDSSGLLLLTDDGQLAQELTHPKYQKIKIYEVKLSTPLQPLHQQMIQEHGIRLEDGVSRFTLERLHDTDNSAWRVIMHEGRNRQIRRTFAALGYRVAALHRTQFGVYKLGTLRQGAHRVI